MDIEIYITSGRSFIFSDANMLIDEKAGTITVTQEDNQEHTFYISQVAGYSKKP